MARITLGQLLARIRLVILPQRSNTRALSIFAHSNFETGQSRPSKSLFSRSLKFREYDHVSSQPRSMPELRGLCQVQPRLHARQKSPLADWIRLTIRLEKRRVYHAFWPSSDSFIGCVLVLLVQDVPKYASSRPIILAPPASRRAGIISISDI